MKVAKVENFNNDKKFITLNIPKVSDVDKRYNVLSPKDKIKFIKHVETIVRRSIEYKQYVSFLKAEIDMTKCAFFNNVTTKNSNDRVSIEIHHEPFTLFDITNIVTDRFIGEDMDMNPLMVAEEVMMLHYRNLVGLIPLSITVHQLVHDGKLFVPLQYVYGDYTSFIEGYDSYISSDLRDMLMAKLRMSQEISSHDTTILETKYVYLNVDGFSLPQVV